MAIADRLKLDDKGLLGVIVQDCATREVLMFAHANPEAVEKTLSTGKAHYWSRSRKKLWLKGESSGHTQAVKEILIDCDGDCLIYRVEQKGGACHEGYRSCFFRRLEPSGGVEVVLKRVFDPKDVY